MGPPSDESQAVHILTQLIDWQHLLIFAAICVPLERLLPLHSLPILRKGWKADIAYLLVNGLLVRLGLAFVLLAVASAASLLMPQALTAAIAAQPLWLQIIEAILIGDFCLYWAHRALHANRILWRLHSIHHSVEELDWVAACHAHPIDDVILAGAAICSICVLGFSPLALAAYLGVYTWISFAVHLNTRITIGPLRWVIGSPEFHHWHHSNESDARDRNFASIVPLWDIMFGTMFLPKGRVPKIYGTDDAAPSGYANQLLHPFIRRVKRPQTGSAPAPKPVEPATGFGAQLTSQ